MIYPDFISPGALVGLVAPASKISEHYIAITEKYLAGIGMRCIKGDSVVGQWNQFGGTDQQRADDLNSMILNPEVDVIWCMRGGYGSVRILDLVNFEVLKKNPKWLVGFSDITVFHSMLQNKLNIASVHGPMPKNLDKTPYCDTGMDQLWDFLQGNYPIYDINSHPLNRCGKCSGQLIGGNLTILSMLKGSDIDFDPRGKILFIEEVGEKLYHLDRLLQSLKIAGKLEGLEGLVVGQMTDMIDNDTPYGLTEYQIIAKAVEAYNFPVLFGFPSGHGYCNMPILMGQTVEVDVSMEGVKFIYQKK